MLEVGLYRKVWQQFNRLLEYVDEISPKQGHGVKTNRSPNGTMISVDAVPDTGSEIQQFKLKSVQGDYITCRSWNGTSEGSSDVFIAKPFRLRRDPFDQQTIVFPTYTASYSYTNNTQRTETISGVNEEQVVIPVFNPNFDIIYAIDCDGLNISTVDDEPISLIDLNLDGRAWAGPANV